MKKIFYIFPIAALISSCSPIVYTSTNHSRFIMTSRSMPSNQQPTRYFMMN